MVSPRTPSALVVRAEGHRSRAAERCSGGGLVALAGPHRPPCAAQGRAWWHRGFVALCGASVAHWAVTVADRRAKTQGHIIWPCWPRGPSRRATDPRRAVALEAYRRTPMETRTP